MTHANDFNFDEALAALKSGQDPTGKDVNWYRFTRTKRSSSRQR